VKSVIIAAVGLLAFSSPAHGQDAIQAALAAAPARAAEDAAVIKWNADYTYETLKEGTSDLVCYDRSDQRDRRPFEVQCTSMANLDRVAQNRRFRDATANRDDESAMIEAAEADGTRAPVRYGSIWYLAAGPDQASARIHTTVAVPGATEESTGFSLERSTSGVFLMQPGTGGAHLMIPGR
jgi:hypothetical protein